MKISVDLQEPFSYMPVWIILGLVLLGVGLIAWIVARRKLRDRLRAEKKQKIKKIRPEALPRVKARYIGMLDKTAWEYSRGAIDKREAYQRMSRTIRLFVNKVTGIRVQHCTLSEIREMNIPILTSLVAEYYEPEFARDANADVNYSLQRTRGAIERWY